MMDHDEDFHTHILFLVCACLYLDMYNVVGIENGIQINLYRYRVLLFITGTQHFNIDVQGSSLQSVATLTTGYVHSMTVLLMHILSLKFVPL
jgi:hypothetical protein